MAISKLPTNASLKEVMDKFEEISLQDFSSINIIVRSELPITGKENQICILSDIHTTNIILSPKQSDKSNDANRIFMLIGADTPYSFADLGNKTTKVLLSFLKCTQLINGVEQQRETYICRSGAWVKLTSVDFVVYDKGSFLNAFDTGNLVATNTNSYYSTITNSGGVLTLKGNNNTMYAGFDKAIDFTSYSRIKVSVNSMTAGRVSRVVFKIGLVDSLNGTSFVKAYTYDKSDGGTSTPFEVTIDVSDVVGFKYLKFYGWQSVEYSYPTMKISKIWFE